MSAKKNPRKKCHSQPLAPKSPLFWVPEAVCHLQWGSLGVALQFLTCLLDLFSRSLGSNIWTKPTNHKLTGEVVPAPLNAWSWNYEKMKQVETTNQISNLPGRVCWVNVSFSAPFWKDKLRRTLAFPKVRSFHNEWWMRSSQGPAKWCAMDLR